VRQIFSTTNPNRQAGDGEYSFHWSERKKTKEIQDGDHIKRQKDTYYHTPRPNPIICHRTDHTCFSLVTTMSMISKQSETKLQSCHFFNIEAKRTLPTPKFLKIEAKRPLLIPDIRKIEAKRTLLIPYNRTIKVNQTLLSG
jgi:hypothetical protein